MQVGGGAVKMDREISLPLMQAQCDIYGPGVAVHVYAMLKGRTFPPSGFWQQCLVEKKQPSLGPLSSPPCQFCWGGC